MVNLKVKIINFFNFLFFSLDHEYETIFNQIYEYLKEKYPDYPDYLLEAAAKAGTNWLWSIVKELPKEYRERIIILRIEKAKEVAENWIKEWSRSMFGI